MKKYIMDCLINSACDNCQFYTYKRVDEIDEIEYGDCSFYNDETAYFLFCVEFKPKCFVSILDQEKELKIDFKPFVWG